MVTFGNTFCQPPYVRERIARTLRIKARHHDGKPGGEAFRHIEREGGYSQFATLRQLGRRILESN
jgi:hypothetical protein